VLCDAVFSSHSSVGESAVLVDDHHSVLARDVALEVVLPNVSLLAIIVVT